MSTATPAFGVHPKCGPAGWVGAFTGFYPATANDLSDVDPITRFLYAARSVILVISAQSAVIAGLLAAADRRFAVLPFVLVFVGFLVLHGISNLSNDYFGYRRGHDTEDSPRRRYTLHPIASGAVSVRLLATGLVVLSAVALGIAAYFIALRGWGAVVFAVIGAVLLYAYDAAPRALKELGLGEVAAFAVWGPLMIGGGYYVITGRLSGDVFIASVPYGLGVASILIGKHIDQRGFDTSQRQRTLPVLLGEAAARRLNQSVVVGMYVWTFVAIGFGALSPFTLFILLAVPRAYRALTVMNVPAPAEGAGGLHRLAALVPPGLPAAQPGLRLAVHRRSDLRRLLAGRHAAAGLIQPGARFSRGRGSAGGEVQPGGQAHRVVGRAHLGVVVEVDVGVVPGVQPAPHAAGPFVQAGVGVATGVELIGAVQAHVDEIGGDVEHLRPFAGSVGHHQRDRVLAQQIGELSRLERRVPDFDGVS